MHDRVRGDAATLTMGTGAVVHRIRPRVTLRTLHPCHTALGDRRVQTLYPTSLCRTALGKLHRTISRVLAGVLK